MPDMLTTCSTQNLAFSSFIYLLSMLQADTQRTPRADRAGEAAVPLGHLRPGCGRQCAPGPAGQGPLCHGCPGGLPAGCQHVSWALESLHGSLSLSENASGLVATTHLWAEHLPLAGPPLRHIVG